MYVGKKTRWFTIGFISLNLMGCFQFPIQKSSVLEQSISSKMEIVVLDAPKENQHYPFEDSPWGKQVSLQIVSAYFAASGRQCITAIVNSSEQQKSDVLLCQIQNRHWEVVRNFLSDPVKTNARK